MMSDDITHNLVERLRGAWRQPFRERHRCLFIQAADEIERLEKLVAALEHALTDEEGK
jgi:hypothetical protein